LRSPRQGEGGVFRTSIEQGPRSERTRDPPTPKPRRTNPDFVPMFADLKKVERSSDETGVVSDV